MTNRRPLITCKPCLHVAIALAIVALIASLTTLTSNANPAPEPATTPTIWPMPPWPYPSTTMPVPAGCYVRSMPGYQMCVSRSTGQGFVLLNRSWYPTTYQQTPVYRFRVACTRLMPYVSARPTSRYYVVGAGWGNPGSYGYLIWYGNRNTDGTAAPYVVFQPHPYYGHYVSAVPGSINCWLADWASSVVASFERWNRTVGYPYPGSFPGSSNGSLTVVP